MSQDGCPGENIDRDSQIARVEESLIRSTRRAIYRLLEASNCALDTARSAWEFAVTIGELRRDGVNENELRWLVCRGYIEHAREVAASGNERAFDRNASLRLGRRSAFVITSAGAAFGRELLESYARSLNSDKERIEAATRSSAGQSTESRPVGKSDHVDNGNVSPKWDRDRRELRVGSKLVKVFKLPSPMQETILMAFEEEQWPPRIDDPLPGHPDLLPKRRLHDTIKSLNRNQRNCVIRFMGDGTGEGVRWEFSPHRDEASHSNLGLR